MSLPENKWAIFLRGEIDKQLERFQQANHPVVRWPLALTRCDRDDRDDRLGGEPVFLPESNEGNTGASYVVHISPDVAKEIDDYVLDTYQPTASTDQLLRAQVTTIAKYIFTAQCGLSEDLEPNWEDIFKAGYRVVNYPACLPFPWQARMFEGNTFQTRTAAIAIIKQFAHEDPFRRLGVINRNHDRSPRPFFSKVRDSSGMPFAWSCLFFNRPLPKLKSCHDKALCNLCIGPSGHNRGRRYILKVRPPVSKTKGHIRSIGNRTQKREETWASRVEEQSWSEGSSRRLHGVPTGPRLSSNSERTTRDTFNGHPAIGTLDQPPAAHALPDIRLTVEEQERLAFIEEFKAQRQAERESASTMPSITDLELEKEAYQVKIKEAEEEARRQVAEYRQKLVQAELARLEQLRQTELKRKRMEEDDEREAAKRFELNRRKGIVESLRKQIEEEEKRVTILELELSIENPGIEECKTEEGVSFIIDYRDPGTS